MLRGFAKLVERQQSCRSLLIHAPWVSNGAFWLVISSGRHAHRGPQHHQGLSNKRRGGLIPSNCVPGGAEVRQRGGA